ncbi:hypothetical protein [Desulforamulus putei]|nr:hypothetical protein [Desulforamulus putei]
MAPDGDAVRRGNENADPVFNLQQPDTGQGLTASLYLLPGHHSTKEKQLK